MEMHPRFHQQMKNHVSWLNRTMRLIRKGCCSIVPDQLQSQTIAQNWVDWWSVITAARSFAPLPHEFGRGPQTDLNNVPADPIQFTLERVIPERPTVCGRVCWCTTEKELNLIRGNHQAMCKPHTYFKWSQWITYVPFRSSLKRIRSYYCGWIYSRDMWSLEQAH